MHATTWRVWRRSITARAGLLLAVTLVAARQAERAREELDRRGSSLLRTLERHQDLHLAVTLGDAAAAAPVLEDVLASGGDVRYVAAVAADGRVIAAAARAEDPASAVAAELTLHRLEDGAAESSAGVRRFTRAVTSRAAADDLALPGADAAAERVAGHLVLALSADRVARDAWLQTGATVAVTGVALLGAFLAVFVGVARRTRRMMAWAERLATGDLTAELDDDSADELGRLAAALRRARDRTREIVSELRAVSDALGAASTEVRGTATAQLGEAGRQASSVAETGTTLAELRQIFHLSLQHAEKVIALARDSEASSSAGERAVSESATAIAELRGQVEDVGETLGALVERTRRIHELVEVVHDLSEQSHVVALNAALEAAHAGERGRGFQVVAAEVHALAARSRDAAGRVARLVTEIALAATRATDVAGEGRRRAGATVELSKRAGEAIEVLARTIGDSSAAARHIALGTREQGEGVERIWLAMKEIDQSAGEAKARIAALERASQEIAQHSERVQSIARLYRLDRERA